jgi:hypothetical protein
METYRSNICRFKLTEQLESDNFGGLRLDSVVSGASVISRILSAGVEQAELALLSHVQSCQEDKWPV